MDKCTVNGTRAGRPSDRQTPSTQELAERATHLRRIEGEGVMSVLPVESHRFVSAHAAGRVTRYEPLLLQRKEPVGFDANHQKRSCRRLKRAFGAATAPP